MALPFPSPYRTSGVFLKRLLPVPWRWNFRQGPNERIRNDHLFRWHGREWSGNCVMLQEELPFFFFPLGASFCLSNVHKMSELIGSKLQKEKEMVAKPNHTFNLVHTCLSWLLYIWEVQHSLYNETWLKEGVLFVCFKFGFSFYFFDFFPLRKN